MGPKKDSGGAKGGKGSKSDDKGKSGGSLSKKDGKESKEAKGGSAVKVSRLNKPKVSSVY